VHKDTKPASFCGEFMQENKKAVLLTGGWHCKTAWLVDSLRK
jgi:hypothetical protein